MQTLFMNGSLGYIYLWYSNLATLDQQLSSWLLNCLCYFLLFALHLPPSFIFDHHNQGLLVQTCGLVFKVWGSEKSLFCHAAYFYTTILEATTTTANPSKGSLMQSMWLCVLQNQSPLLHVLATRGLQEGQPLFCQKKSPSRASCSHNNSS